ncbi:MAG TPA: hypothetical protein VIN03_24310 [Roseateles sp.]
MHRTQPGLGRTDVDARAGHDQRPRLVFPHQLELRRQARLARLRGADDGRPAAQGLKQVLAQARRLVGIQMDETIDEDELGLQLVLAQQLHHAGQLAQVEFPPCRLLDMGDVRAVDLRRFGRIPGIKSDRSGLRLRAVEMNGNGEFHERW